MLSVTIAFTGGDHIDYEGWDDCAHDRSCVTFVSMLKMKIRRFGGAALRKLGLRKPRQAPGSAFTEAIRGRFGLGPDEDPVDDTERMWFDFSLSSVDRGRYVVTAMGGPAAFRGKHVLDVGCAYGGFLVAAKEAGARSVTGIDINADLLALARLQLDDHNVQGTLELRDITMSVADLGHFDIVLCNDVIEHVTEPVAAATNLASLLDPGGSVFLQIPNAWAVDFMHRDGHYGLFGITLLGRAHAERLWAHSYSDTYGVEHYAPLIYYLDILSRAGFAVRLINPLPDDLDGAVVELAVKFDDLEQRLAALELEDEELAAELRRRGVHEIERFRHLAQIYASSDVAAERDVMARVLWTTYILSFWDLVGTKVK